MLAFAIFVLGLALATLIALGVGGGNVAVAMAPVMAAALGFGLVRLPVRVTALTVIFLILLGDIDDQADLGHWKSPLHLIGQLVIANLNNITGIGFLRFPFVDFLIVALVAILAYRQKKGLDVDGPVQRDTWPLNLALGLSLLTVAGLEIWGIGRGGNLKESVWQIHQMVLLPMLVYVFQKAIRGPQDFTAIARLIVAAAVIKSLVAVYAIEVIARSLGKVPEYATSHSDSVLFVVAMMIVLVHFAEQPTKRNLGRLLWVVPIIGLGLFENARRLAYVSLAASLLAVYLLMPWSSVKRKLTRGLVFGAPLWFAYVAVGLNTGNALFAPVHSIRSVITGEDVAGADYRDMENFNLLVTWSNNQLMGSGFGHKFEEPVKLPDISHVMPQYQYQPHNTVLWLWSVAGIAGFTALWLFMPIAVFFAVRSYRLTTWPVARTAALVCVCTVIAYLNQCYGDMGTISWINVIMMAVALTVVGKLATFTGAWPQRPVKAQKDRTFFSVR